MIFADQVDLLLSQAQPYPFYRTAVRGMAPSIVSPEAYKGEAGPATYVAGPGEVKLVSEPALLLERVYADASPSVQHTFSALLLSKLKRANARVVARSLAASHQLNALPAGDELATWEELWRGLIHALRFESHLFSESDLEAVDAAAERRLERIVAVEERRRAEQQRVSDAFKKLNMGSPTDSSVRWGGPPRDPVVDEARAVITRIRYLRLANTIREQRNPSVDVDRQQLLSRLQAMGFSATLSAASEEIEDRLVAASTEFDVKAVMDLVRTFLEEVVEEASRKIEPRIGKPAPVAGKGSHYAPYRQYLEGAGILGLEESALLQSLYNFLSNQGAHKLGTAPEQLRVAHVTVIEWCLLIVGRVKVLLGV